MWVEENTVDAASLRADGIILKRAESFSASPDASRPFATAATEPRSVMNDPIRRHAGIYNSARESGFVMPTHR
jgi:hypothetical protein